MFLDSGMLFRFQAEPLILADQFFNPVNQRRGGLLNDASEALWSIGHAQKTWFLFWFLI
jgi:hypothetical protein